MLITNKHGMNLNFENVIYFSSSYYIFGDCYKVCFNTVNSSTIELGSYETIEDANKVCDMIKEYYRNGLKIFNIPSQEELYQEPSTTDGKE